jgi:hypothetical protein
MLARGHRLGIPGSDRLWRSGDHTRKNMASMAILRYWFRQPGGASVKVVIDPSDWRHLPEPASLDWSDVYFKTNRWPERSYPDKVRPLVNANGLLTPRSVDRLRLLRHERRDVDLVYWTRVWAPTEEGNYSAAEVDAILEHQLRLFETLARLDCRSDLLAILPESSCQRIDRARVVERLAAAGVSVRTGWGDIDSERFWCALARAKVVVLRPGNHLCISWRMFDLLAMGACVVCDGTPFPAWPAPLRSGFHYLDGGCRLDAEYRLPDVASYRGLNDAIEDLLARPGRQAGLRAAAGAYFDRHCTFDAIGRHLVTTAVPVGVSAVGRTMSRATFAPTGA